MLILQSFTVVVTTMKMMYFQMFLENLNTRETPVIRGNVSLRVVGYRWVQVPMC